MTNEKITIPGVREELRCPECGRYDRRLGATSEETEAIFKYRYSTSFEGSAFCQCYRNSTIDGNCPHCNVDIDDLWDYEITNSGTEIDCPHCDKPIFAQPFTQIKLTSLRPKAKV